MEALEKEKNVEKKKQKKNCREANKQAVRKK
jgi:hypothetical protein